MYYGIHSEALVQFLSLRALMTREQRAWLIAPEARSLAEAFWLALHMTRQDSLALWLGFWFMVYVTPAVAIGNWISSLIN
ncbi:hypothetical protein [Sulfurisoma sediminicola]|uniref:Uncharacterized protein n=1 Tax=Sulfurisoma sediminicola TaxID=1381557 RepID=A0A497XD26_9PROT|nr:hypothetical protein [Sulfurisoma sediminicola]RLJ64599.1 hypothetical protein DFR35_1240 [Sulfurisoma sediminicola]